MVYISLGQLRDEFPEYSLSALAKMIERGQLPAGEKSGKYRLVPAFEARLILSSRKRRQRGRPCSKLIQPEAAPKCLEAFFAKIGE